MSIDIQDVCSASYAEQQDLTLATALAVLFSVYIVLSIGLSGLTIYTASEAAAPSKATARAQAMQAELAPYDFAATAAGNLPRLDGLVRRVVS